MPATTIDIHPHIISADTNRYPRAPLGGHQSDWSRTRPVSLEQMLAAMDEAGVQKSAIVQASTCYGHDNSYVADAVAAHPDRFTGVFSADVLAPDAPEKMRYWLSKGLTGMRLFTFGSTMSEQASWLDDPKSYPAWECAGELGLSICLQMSAKGLPQVVRMVERFPNVRVILDHLARPVLEDGPPYAAAASLFDLAHFPNVYLKLTPRTFAEVRKGKATPETFFPKLVKEFGAARLAWGSNYPSSEGTLPELLATARSSLACLSAEDQEWIFAKTAQVLYPALAK
ncbi:MAG TPA: amidohydrolase family protein [Xanthobacteraceae bacterium]|nr:amidohydrolase family protein [Xanthobacteraceae bacterium]